MNDLTSKKYKQQLMQKHKRQNWWGGTIDERFYNIVQREVKKHNPSTVLDYGCGKGQYIKKLESKFPNIQIFGYDLGNPKYQNIKFDSFDMVYSLTVLEHIEPEHISNVLTHISFLFKNLCILVIDTYPAMAKLPDGKNAHLIIEGFSWWKEQIANHIDGKLIKETSIPIEEFKKKRPIFKNYLHRDKFLILILQK